MVLQDAEDFCTWAQKEKTAITCKLVACQDYERCKKFLTLKFSNACIVSGTVKVLIADCFSGSFNKNAKCDDWPE